MPPLPDRLIALAFMATAFSSACSNPVAPSPAPVQGGWIGSMLSENGGDPPKMALQLTQSGDGVSGFFSCTTPCMFSGQLTGSMSARQLTGQVRPDTEDAGDCSEFSGLVSADGRSIDGWYRCTLAARRDFGSWHVDKVTP
jgi:hypothetical protein